MGHKHCEKFDAESNLIQAVLSVWKQKKRENIGPLQKLCNGPTVHWFHEANGPMGPNTKSHQNSAISVENFQFPIRHTKCLGFLYTFHLL